MRPYVRLQFNVLFIRALFMVTNKNIQNKIKYYIN